jgi:membrane fusion protein, multidrug efflux system
MLAPAVKRAPAVALTGLEGHCCASTDESRPGVPGGGAPSLPGCRRKNNLSLRNRAGDTPVKRSMMLVAVAVLVVVAAGCGTKEQAAAPPPEVYVADVVQKDVPVYMELVGQTKGAQDVEIRARVEGFLETVAFSEGSFVHKGDLLYKIDPKPLEATLAAARANLATAEARLEKCKNDVARYRPLVEQQAVSRQELDNALSAQDAARAQVDASKAAVEKAALDLGYTTIASPIDGLVGTTLVKAGNLVGRGESTLLTTVSQIDPILFRAGLSEAEYLRFRKRVAPGDESVASIPVQLILADGSVHPQSGHVQAAERAIDATTGTLMLQFSFPNPEKLVRPGQYGRARFILETKAGALLVPQRAVSELQNLYNVAVVGADDVVTFRSVKVGPRVEGLWVIEEGLKPGERVVVEGLQRIREGLKVSPKPVPPAAPGTSAAEPAGEAR